MLLGALEVLGGAPSDAGSDEELCLTVSRSSPVTAVTETIVGGFDRCTDCSTCPRLEEVQDPSVTGQAPKVSLLGSQMATFFSCPPHMVVLCVSVCLCVFKGPSSQIKDPL